ncbi:MULTISPECIES: alkene reductase [Sphingobacterium]|uniref:alkene reductase n=1 Tax=Sphingobacterium TaxID=28453 RepID=UPI00257A2FA7|nr:MULTISPECIES: alkene reductase [Sphingobacterium]
MNILKPYFKNGFQLTNRIVMAPMTRSRAIDNIPNDLMATYYKQRSGAGLIITEGTAPVPDALGYPRIPGIFTEEQIAGWRKVTEQVHSKNSKIFLQLMHTGRIGHIDNLPPGARLVGPSDIKAVGEIYTDSKGKQEHSVPSALTITEIEKVVEGFSTAAINAIKAGFDGVEIHSANGYLLEQFLNPNVNIRNDKFGGDVINRSRIILEIAKKTVAAIGKEKTGIRFSPFSTLGNLQPYDPEQVHDTYVYLAKELNKLGILYIHFVMSPNIQEKTLQAIRTSFENTIIASSGYTAETAEAALSNGFADIVAFGRAFLSNPDYVKRIEMNAPLNQVDFSTLYTTGQEGYTDYPVLE